MTLYLVGDQNAFCVQHSRIKNANRRVGAGCYDWNHKLVEFLLWNRKMSILNSIYLLPQPSSHAKQLTICPCPPSNFLMKSPNCADHILTDQSAEVDTNNLSFTAILVTEALWPFRVWRYSPLTMSHFLIVWSAEAVKRTRCDMSTARLKTPPLCPKHRYHWVNSLLTAVTVAAVTIFYLRFCGSVFERLFHKLLVCWHNVIVCFLLRCTYVTGVKYVRRGNPYLKMFWDKCPTWLPKALPSNRNCRWQDSLVSRCTYH